MLRHILICLQNNLLIPAIGHGMGTGYGLDTDGQHQHHAEDGQQEPHVVDSQDRLTSVLVWMVYLYWSKEM